MRPALLHVKDTFSAVEVFFYTDDLKEFIKKMHLHSSLFSSFTTPGFMATLTQSQILLSELLEPFLQLEMIWQRPLHCDKS